MNCVVLALNRLARLRCWTLSASHLAGARNVLADSLSRLSAQRGDMGTGRPDVSPDSSGPPLSGDGCVRDQGDPQSPEDFDPISRPLGHGDRRTEVQLDPEVVRLFVPTYVASLRVLEIKDVPRYGGAHHPDVAEQCVVFSSAEVDIPPQAAGQPSLSQEVQGTLSSLPSF